MAGAEELTIRGEELYRGRRSEEALAVLLEALKVLPSHARAQSNVGVVYWSLGQQTQALKHLQQAIALDQKDPSVVLNCAEVYVAAGRQDMAQAVCQQALDRRGEERSIRQYLANLSTQAETEGSVASSHYLREENFVQQTLHDAASVINYAIERFQYKKYLEIGCRDDDTFAQINAAYKVGVDPVSGGTHRMTSDQFFELSDDTFDIVFVDGLHYAEQVYKDVRNALRFLRPKGLIVMHDCRPSEEVHQLRQAKTYVWNGDVWKAFVLLRAELTLDAITGDFDHGIGLVRARANSAPLQLEKSYLDLSWEEYQSNREQWLRLSTEADIKRWL